VRYCEWRRAVPVKKVYIASISPHGVDTPVVDHGVVTLTQLLDDGVACIAVVDGSRLPPQVEVIVGDEDRTGTGTTTTTNNNNNSNSNSNDRTIFIVLELTRASEWKSTCARWPPICRPTAYLTFVSTGK